MTLVDFFKNIFYFIFKKSTHKMEEYKEVPFELVILENNKLEAIRGISDDEAKRILESSRQMHLFHYMKRKVEEIELNYDDYFRTIDRYNELFKKNLSGEDIGYDYKEKSFIDINRAYNNYIASFKSFTELCREKIKKYYGDGSDKHAEFEKTMSGFFDGYLGYRLLLKTRDFALHSHFAIQQVSYVQEKGRITDISYDKEMFLKNPALKILKKDIENFPNFFPVEPYITEVQPLIGKVLQSFAKITESHFIDAVSHILELAKETNSTKIGLNRTNFVRADRLVHNDTKVIPVFMAEEFKKLIDG